MRGTYSFISFQICIRLYKDQLSLEKDFQIKSLEKSSYRRQKYTFKDGKHKLKLQIRSTTGGHKMDVSSFKSHLPQ